MAGRGKRTKKAGGATTRRRLTPERLARLANKAAARGKAPRVPLSVLRANKAAKAVPLARRGGVVALTVTGIPRTKKNSAEIAMNRRTGQRLLATSPAYKRWAAAACEQVRALKLAPIHEPVNVTAHIYRSRRTGDLDNYLNAVGDMLETAGLLVNDDDIHGWDGSRRYIDRANPRVEITITPLALADAATPDAMPDAA